MTRVLIVDDMPEVLDLLRRVLEGNGFEVTEAHDGAEALSRARQHPPDLVISDVFMPTMDGYTLLRHWKADDRLRTIPFILCTATYTEPKDEQLALDMGADAFILKPANPALFVARLQEVLAQAAQNDWPTARVPQAREETLLKDYAQVIVRKLEEKAHQLDQTNRALQEELARSQQAEAEARRAHEALRESEALYHSLVENLQQYLFRKDLAGRFTFANSRFCEMVGRPLGKLIGLTDFDVFQQALAEKYRHDDQVVMGTHQNLELEERHLASDGHERFVQVVKSPLCDRNGTVIGVQGIFWDITERKQAEEARVKLEAQLVQAQKLEAIGTLASGVAHEINNPINGVMNYAQLILDQAPSGSRAAIFAREIIRETERVAAIVRNLLQFARQDNHGQSRARLADIVRASLSLLQTVIRRDQITLSVEVPEDLPQLRCRSQQIQQVLMNLIANARDALNARYTGAHADKIIRLGAERVEREGRLWVRTVVEDHGIGITEAVRHRLFDPFFTTKPRDQGTGLGLSISRSIVKEHHGELSLVSKPGQWTRFQLELPVAEDGNGS